jgi:hypothetical protein
MPQGRQLGIETPFDDIDGLPFAKGLDRKRLELTDQLIHSLRAIGH